MASAAQFIPPADLRPSGFGGRCIHQLPDGTCSINGSCGFPDSACTQRYEVLPTTPLDDMSKVRLITFHYNPHKYRRPRETCLQWQAALGVPIECWEMVLDDAEPEIPGSIVVRGTSERNIMWQKERLINLAVSRMPDGVEYVGWLDHDLVFENPEWLRQAVAMLDSGIDCVQPFAQLRYLDQQGGIEIEKTGAVCTLHTSHNAPHTGPGGAWITRKDFLQRIGGLHEMHIVGGGDSVWFTGITKTRVDYLKRQSLELQKVAMAWVDRVGAPTFNFVPGRLVHLWHGHKKCRQYVTRDAILRDNKFDSNAHVEVDSAGLLAWTDAAPDRLRTEVTRFFLARHDDGGALPTDAKRPSQLLSPDKPVPFEPTRPRGISGGYRNINPVRRRVEQRRANAHQGAPLEITASHDRA